MADFRFRICNELLEEEDENSVLLINFTPETFTKAKEKLKKFIIFYNIISKKIIHKKN